LNALTNLPNEIGNMVLLKELYLEHNNLTNLPSEIGNMVLLKELYLNSNHLTSLPNEIGHLSQLETLELAFNALTSIPNEIGNLSQLETLKLSFNALTSIPNEIGNLLKLQYLDLFGTQLSALPLNIIHLPNLESFLYYNNPLTHLHPAISRWRKKSVVYGCKQNVHCDSIESSTNASIIKFVSSVRSNMTNISDVLSLIDQMNIDYAAKNLLKSYTISDYVHSSLKLTFGEVVAPVLDYINSHQNKQDLMKILADEIIASQDKCFQGRLSRLINVLNGYHPSVNIHISDNEQISNVIIMLKKKYNATEAIVANFIKEMQDRDYAPSIIDEWIGYIEDA
jgi:hypothetical protein